MRVESRGRVLIVNLSHMVYTNVIGLGASIMVVCRALLFYVAVAWTQQPSTPTPVTRSPILSVAPAPSDTLQFEAQLPDFEAKDINGRLWRSSDLRGKLTVIDIWSTFPRNPE